MRYIEGIFVQVNDTRTHALGYGLHSHGMVQMLDNGDEIAIGGKAALFDIDPGRRLFRVHYTAGHYDLAAQVVGRAVTLKLPDEIRDAEALAESDERIRQMSRTHAVLTGPAAAEGWPA